MSAREQQVLDAVADLVRPAVLERFDVTSCVATVRIAIDVLDYFDIRAVPVPVEGVVLNPDALAAFETSGGSWDAVHEAVAAAPDLDTPGGAWTIGLGVQDPARPEGAVEAGHVVVGLPGRAALLELSMDQVTRPTKNLTFGPALLGASEEFLTAPGETLAYRVPQPQGAGEALVIYTHAPEHLYRRSPNWRRKAGGSTASFKEVTGPLIRQIRAGLTP